MASRGWLCERCAAEGKLVPAKVAHHKIYLTRQNISDPSISLSWDNLEALCQGCHNKEHHKEEKRFSFDASGNLYPPHASAR